MSFDDRYPEPPELTEEELARQRRAARRTGLVLLALCLVLAAVALVVLLSLNSDTREDGARGDAPADQA